MTEMDELPPLIQAMLEPSFYSYPVASTVLLQTHISWVVLTGTKAYKIKKPVQFSFLDFSTLTKRKKWIELEMDLNRRYASEIYLGVIPIYWDGKEYSWQNKGEICEYCLEMREFPQEAILSHIFERGSLTIDMMVELGRELASLHKSAPLAPIGYGSPEALQQIAEQNYNDSLPFVSYLIRSTDLERIHHWTQELLKNNTILLQERVANGFIADCHGDLHLNNICVYKGRIQLFDCIEFNPDFRYIDKIYDASFVFMDLLSRNSNTLAYTFLNTYLEETGDYTGAKLLYLYTSYRAMIRGKVYGLMLADTTFESGKKNMVESKSRHFFELAARLATSKKGKVFIMSGLSGSGKSTIASYLAIHRGAIQIRSDAVRKHLAGIDLHTQAPDTIYSPAMSEKTYEQMERYGLELADYGIDVILDAKYDTNHLRERVISLCLQNGFDYTIVFCDAKPETIQKRLLERKNDISDATIALMAKQLEKMEKPVKNRNIKFVDTEKEWRLQVDEIILS